MIRRGGVTDIAVFFCCFFAWLEIKCLISIQHFTAFVVDMAPSNHSLEC